MKYMNARSKNCFYTYILHVLCQIINKMNKFISWQLTLKDGGSSKLKMMDGFSGVISWIYRAIPTTNSSTIDINQSFIGISQLD